MVCDDFIASDGTFIAHEVEGPVDAPVLVLSNSIGTTMDLWAGQMGGLTAGFRVVRYDARGHGRSSVPRGDSSIARMGRDVLELMDFLGVPQFAFCGISLGGMVGQWLGVNAPGRLDNLVLCNTSAFMGPAGWETRIQAVHKGGMAAIAAAVLDRWFTPAFRESQPGLVTRMQTILLGIDPIGYAGCCAAIRDMDQRGTIAAIATPTLVIGGTQDKATPPDHSQFLAASIPAARLEMLEAAHLSNLEQPEAFMALLLAFLNRHVGPASLRARLS